MLSLFVFNSPFIYFCLLDAAWESGHKIIVIPNERCQVLWSWCRIPGSEDFGSASLDFPSRHLSLGPQEPLRSPQKEEKCTHNGTMNEQASV